MNQRLYDEVVLVLPSGTQIPLRLIHRTPESNDNTPTFYIMKDKVSNRLYAEVTGASPECKLPFSKQPDQPVFCVNATEANEFASEIGGRLPTPMQWDKAAGQFDAPQGTYGPYLLDQWNSSDKESIAVNRTQEEGPMPTGRASADKSYFLVNDMAGNGLEWTNEVYWNQSNEQLSDVGPQLGELSYASVTLRGASYLATSPYEYEAEKQLAPDYLNRDAETSFRVVIQVSGFTGK
jgi:formylglycine-generating enzyme required for sulfatase activity